MAALLRLASEAPRRLVATAPSVTFGVEIAAANVAAAVIVQERWLSASSSNAALQQLSTELRAVDVPVPGSLALAVTAPVFTGAGAAAAAAAANGGGGSVATLLFAWGVGPLMAFYGCFVFELMILYSALKANGVQRWLLSFNDPANSEGFSEVQMKALLTIGMGAMTLASVSIKNPASAWQSWAWRSGTSSPSSS